MNIVLMGYRGTGKSTIAKLLSDRLQRKLYDIDALIVKSAGVSIPGIVDRWGWSEFRKMEADVVQEVSAESGDGVVDCGGGVVLDERNIVNLRRNGRIVLLTAGLETILKRIEKDPNRPPLKEGLTFEEEQRRVLAERDPKYRAAADMVCDTTTDSPEETAAQITKFFTGKSWL